MRFTVKFAMAAALCLFIAATGLAQYGGGTGGMGGGGAATGGVYTPPKGGYKTSTGLAIGGVAAAGLVATYLIMRRRKSLVGCVQESSGGTTLTSEKDGKNYVLDEGNLGLKVGQRVKLAGKKAQGANGEPEFVAKKLVKDYGACGTRTAMAHASHWHL